MDSPHKKQNNKNKKDDANDATKIDNTGNALLAFTLLKNTKSKWIITQRALNQYLERK